jgi:HSP20 family protein
MSTSKRKEMSAMSNTAIEKRKEQPLAAQSAPQQQQAQRTEPATVFTPLVDVWETHEAFYFEADLPGVKSGDVDVSYENGALTIAAKVQPRQAAGASYAWQEYGVGHFYRSFAISTPVDADGIRAELKDGVLKLYVPKQESARVKKIDVRSA